MQKPLESESITTSRFCDEMNEQQLSKQEKIKQALQERIAKYMQISSNSQL